MDFLVRTAASHKLNPVGHLLVPLDENGHEMQFKPSQTLGFIHPSTVHIQPKHKKRDTSARDSTKIPFEVSKFSNSKTCE